MAVLTRLVRELREYGYTNRRLNTVMEQAAMAEIDGLAVMKLFESLIGATIRFDCAEGWL